MLLTGTVDPHVAPATEAERLAIVHGFQQCTLPKPRWTHAAHLTVGAHFVFVFPWERALSEMRHGVRSYNESVGTANTDTGGYHETLTRMWLMVLAALLDAEPTTTALAFARLAVQRYGHRRDLHTHLYSFDVVKSSHARREWIAPDVVPPGGILHC